MSKIRTLDEHLTNMIAAGEVVERPSGAIKEMIENALDAKARRIDVMIREGGMQEMIVTDDGEGMDPQDALQAFRRHSTSKIAKEQDLWHIHTLGFRGEALPSIAAVSHVVCLTNDGQQGTKVELAYGKLIEAGVGRADKGTRMEVRGLFHKTPARLKHLRSTNYEAARVAGVIQSMHWHIRKFLSV